MKMGATSLVFGLALLLYTSQSLITAADKQQIAAKATFLVMYRPAPRGWQESRFLNNR